MKKITIYLENKQNNLTDCSLELISKADELKQFAFKNNENYLLEGVLIADEIMETEIEKAYKTGLDRFILIKTNDEDILKVNYPDYFLDYYKDNKSEIILFPATFFGRIIASKICANLNCGLVADCTDVEFILKNNELKLAPTRPTFGAELMATILSKKYPECATIRPGVFKIDYKYDDKKGEFVEFNLNKKENNSVKLLSSIIKNIDEVDFDNAKIILSSGFGLYTGDNSYFKKLKKLADKLNVQYGTTRKAVDYNLEDKKYQIGQTGATVKPKLYIAFGISGAIQHITGIKNSDKIVAINTDNDAEIFKYADYKIVADAKKIIDDMLNE